MAKTTTRLEPGEHSIDRNTVYCNDSGKFLLDWHVRDHSGRLHKRRTQGDSKGEVRRRAKATAKVLLTSGNTAWKPTAKMVDYIDQVAKPLIADAPDERLREQTRRRYLIVLQWIRDEMKGLSIADATRFRTQEQALQAISAARGRETGRQARNVLGKYVNQQLVRDGLIPASPLVGMSIDLGTHKASNKPAGGVALTKDEYVRTVDALLAIDPAEGVSAGRGRYTLAQKIAKVANTVDALLIGAATGLRIGEVITLTWDRVLFTDDDVRIVITPAVSKTKKGRTAPVLDDRVADHIRARHAASGGAGYVVGAPADPLTMWDRDNAQKAARKLFNRLSDELGIKTLRTHSTHMWRATINTLLSGVVPEVQRAAFLGHDEAVNRASYTDTTDVSGMVAAFRTTLGTTTSGDETT